MTKFIEFCLKKQVEPNNRQMIYLPYGNYIQFSSSNIQTIWRFFNHFHSVRCSIFISPGI